MHLKPLRISLWLTLILLGVLFAVACAALPETPEPRATPVVPFESCQISTPGVENQLAGKCTSLSVYENRAAQSGRQIDLHIVVLPAISRKPASDPLFFLAGGPGEAASESFLIVSSAFEAINQKRDIVLVDQRGTGQSHALQCQDTGGEEISAYDSKQVKAAVQHCLTNLVADPRFYTTAIAMDDLDQVRQALGYEQINLYGVSYGTRAALAYMRQYPQHVRSAILDGVAPPNWTLGPDSAKNAQQALNNLFDRCIQEPACKEAYPNLRSEFQSLLNDLKTMPAHLSIPDPTSGEKRDITVDQDSFASTIFNMSYTSETAALLPLLVHTASIRNDLSLIAAQGLSDTETVSARLSEGMRFSVMCSEDIPFFPANLVETGYLGDNFIRSFRDVCSIWPRGEIPANFKDPVTSSAPVLILSGADDPVTPPANGELAASTLSNHLHLVVAGQGHVNIFRGCIPRLVNSFIEKGSAVGLNTACVQEIDAMPFFINFSGPTP